MTDTYCIRELKKLRDRDAEVVDKTCKQLQDVILNIRCEAKPADWMQVETALHAVRLAIRIFPHVRIDFADRALTKQAKQLAGRLNSPFTDQEPTFHLTIGASARSDDVRIDASGWLARTAPPGAPWTSFSERQLHPSTPMLAACAGIGGVTSIILKRPWNPMPQTSFWDGHDNGPPVPNPLTLDLHLMSLGSIGSTSALLIERWPNVQGHLTLIDKDTFADHNPARYSAMEGHDLGKSKVKQIKERLRTHANLDCHAHLSTIENWAEALTTQRISVAIISFDNLAARAHAADTFPAHSIAALVNANDAVAVNCSFESGPCSFCVVGPRTSKTDGLKLDVARRTGIPVERVNVLTQYGPAAPNNPEGLTRIDLRVIETKWKLKTGALREYKGKRLLKLLEDQRHLAYSTVRLTGEAAAINLPLPMPSASAGALAFNAALRHQLGYTGNVNEFRYDPMGGQLRPGITTKHAANLCLCQDPFRQTLHRELHKAPA